MKEMQYCNPSLSFTHLSALTIKIIMLTLRKKSRLGQDMNPGL